MTTQEAAATLTVAHNLRNNGQTTEAIKLYHQLFAFHHDQGHRQTAGEAMQMIGVCYRISGDYGKSTDSLISAESYFRKYDLRICQASALRDLGITSAGQKNWDQALSLLGRSLDLADEWDDKVGCAITLTKIAMCTHPQGHPGGSGIALAIFKSVKADLTGKPKGWFFLATTYMHTAEIYWLQKHWDQMEFELKAALKLFDAHNEEPHVRRRAQVHGLLAHTYLGMEKQTLARKHWNETRAFFNQTDVTDDAKQEVKRDIRYNDLAELLDT